MSFADEKNNMYEGNNTDNKIVENASDGNSANGSTNEAPAENREASSASSGETPKNEPRQTYETEEETQTMWSEPKYEAQNQDGDDVYSPSVNTNQAVKEKKPKKKHGFLKAVCLVLACVLLSSASCYVVVSYMLDNAEPTETVTKTEVVLNTSTSTDSGSAVALSDSSIANQIYQQAIDFQVVGINTSVSYTNILGGTTTTPVSGTGFVISSDGYILTNYHVISYAALYGYEMTVMFEDGTEIEAEIVGYLEDNDIAVIKIDATGLTLNPVTLGDSDSLKVGDVIYAIGNPLGELTYTMTEGIVSATDRIITTSNDTSNSYNSMNMFQISAAVNSGNSGGPVYNTSGEVVGIVTAKYSDSGVEGLGFAIPINDAVSIATQLIENGYVPSASLGITCSATSDVYSSFAIQYYELPTGVVVMSVNEGSGAEAAGILTGDIITALNGETVTSIDELKYQLRQCSPGDTGTITVYRFNSSSGNSGYYDLTIVFDESASTSSTAEEEVVTDETSVQSEGGSEDSRTMPDGGMDSFGSWFGGGPFSQNR